VKLRPWLRVAAALAILAGLLWWHSTSAFVAALKAVDGPSVAAALAAGLFSTVCAAARWRLIARRLGLPLPLTGAVAAYYRALFLNAVLPAGVLGDVHRAVSHGHRAGDVGRGVRAVVLERAAGQIVLVLACLAVLPARPSLLASLTPALIPAALVLSVLLALARWRHRAVAAALAEARGVLAAWPGIAGLSVAALAGHLALFVVAARAAGSHAPLIELLPLLLLALLVMGLPINVGGWGPREAVTALAFGAAGLGSAEGLTISVVYGVLTFVSALPGALALLVQHGEAAPERPDEAGERVPALAGGGQ
jgi:uncharacterized membrane protein YbhN (UPF0104 family)